MKEHSKSKKYLWIILGLFILVIFIGALSSGQDQKRSSEIYSRDDIKKIIENECTDAKYGINEDFNPISITNYNFDIYDYSYTDQGDMIYLATWNGKSKTTADQVSFQCYASKNSDNSVTVYYIQAGEQDIWKGQSDLDYSSYLEDGSPMHPELH